MAEPVTVVGGGLAGVSAALRLADAGRSVTLVESRPWLGGAAFSFRRDGLTIDNGQHVFLRCCTAYRQLLARIGGDRLTTLQRRLDIPIMRAGHRPARLYRTPGAPAPLHLAAALSRYGHLSPLQRAGLARAALRLRMLDPADPELDRCSFGDFLRSQGQSAAAVDRLWAVIGTATLNARPDEASLALAVKVFRTGLLESAGAADLGFATVPLGRLHDTAARAALEAAGVEVLTGHRAVAVSGWSVEVRSGDSASTRRPLAGAVVLAVPPAAAFGLCPQLHKTAAAPAAGLSSSPILNLHVVFDRQVTDHPVAAAVESPVHWIFDRTAASGLREQRPRAQYLAVTISAADDLIGIPNRRLIPSLLPALADLLPGAGRAEIVDAWTSRERTATFRSAPGSGALRPTAGSGPEGVWLAGAWLATGWPDTMESAVRSGTAAAEAVLTDIPATTPPPGRRMPLNTRPKERIL